MKGFYLSAGLVDDPQHCERIGPALWEFLWLISHETKDAGKVLNGAPVTAVRIAADLGRHVNTVRINLARLEKQAYIVREMGQSSVYHFRIANTKKWQHPTENSEPVEATTSQKTVSRITENCEPASQKTVSPIRKVDNIDRKTLKPSAAKSAATVKFNPFEVDLPEWLPKPLWERWANHRKELSHKLTPTSVREQLKQLEAWRLQGCDPVAILETSITNGWQGIFKPKVVRNGNRAQQRTTDNLAALEAAFPLDR
jgi:hypothetical protein